MKVNSLDSVAIENTFESYNSSKKAHIHTLFYPGEYTTYDHSAIISMDIFKSVKSFFEKA